MDWRSWLWAWKDTGRGHPGSESGRSQGFHAFGVLNVETNRRGSCVLRLAVVDAMSLVSCWLNRIHQYSPSMVQHPAEGFLTVVHPALYSSDFDSTVFPQAMGLDALLSSHPIEVEVRNHSHVSPGPIPSHPIPSNHHRLHLDTVESWSGLGGPCMR